LPFFIKKRSSFSPPQFKKNAMSEEQKNIRNFCIISHIDHGKSTLADRFLELTDTVPKEKMQPQFLDMMPLEREKGITIKMQPVRMEYKGYILNLIDTPGHVDFSYEVSRSLAAVEGAILLVDATKGIQAQTIANLELAKKQNLVIIPAVNKIDSPQAKIKETKEELSNLLKIPQAEIFEISAKKNINVQQLLDFVIEKIAISKGKIEKPFRALIFDSKYDIYKGVIAYIRVIDGEIKDGEKIYLMAGKAKSEIKELGFFKPDLKPQKELKTGEIGYIATGIKEPGKVKVGDTLTKINIVGIEPLPGYREPKSMVFASIYPENADDFGLLKDALTKLKLNDPSLNFELEAKEALGRGFQCGFLGTLHIEIISERLFREFKLNLVISTPQVSFQIIDKKDQIFFIKSASEWPDPSRIKEIQEPWVKLEIITPTNYLGQVFKILEGIETRAVKNQYLSRERIVLFCEAPLREIIVGFYEKLKSQTQGFASMNYGVLDFRPADLVKLEILIAGKKEEAFSRIVPNKNSFQEGKKLVKKLKEVLPAQLFSVALQAVVGGKIIARETIRAKGKDVIAPLYGGDYTRKRKLLERQKKGKRELKEKGEIRIPQKAFLEILKG
jgi:GTP-binding protein LepA